MKTTLMSISTVPRPMWPHSRSALRKASTTSKLKMRPITTAAYQLTTRPPRKEAAVLASFAPSMTTARSISSAAASGRGGAFFL